MTNLHVPCEAHGAHSSHTDQAVLHGRGSTAWELLLPALRHSAHDLLPLYALRDVLGTEQVPAVLYGLAAGRLWWKRRALPQAGGTQPRAFSSPTPSDNHPKETQLLVATSKHTPSTAALRKKERPQDNRLILLLALNRHQATFCALLGAKV